MAGRTRNVHLNAIRGNPAATDSTDPLVVVSDHQQGKAAAAIRDAEAVLAEQGTATAQLDMQVIAAVLNAHQMTVEGKERLDSLKHDIEAAVQTRTDLDTPAGAREFQRFLIGKLREMRTVVDTANLDDTSKAALMAAWTSLYNGAKSDHGDPNTAISAPIGYEPSPAGGDRREPPSSPNAEIDALLDSLGSEDPGPFVDDAQLPRPVAQAPTVPAMPSIPLLGGGDAPSQGLSPGAGMQGALPLGEFLRGDGWKRLPEDPDDDPLMSPPDGEKKSPAETDDDAVDEGGDTHSTASDPELALASGPTTVTLPDGDTVTAANPQIAETIKAAIVGTPIADAFQQNGILIPPPGTAVTHPVEPSQVTPGDIGMFTDCHALALGNSKAMINGQIQAIATVSGPNFLGWEHPPAAATATAPPRAEAATPTRPSSAVPTSQ